MSTTPDPTVVVVAEERRRRLPVPLIAGVVALLLGGSTFAVWSATQPLTGGTIKAGNLNLTSPSGPSYWDVSGDRADAAEMVTGTVDDNTSGSGVPGHKITDISTWRIVPGDKVAAVYTVTVVLEGDNMVAKLDVASGAGSTLNNTSMAYAYDVYHAGVKVNTTPIALGGEQSLYLAAPEGASDGQGAGAADATTTVDNNGKVVYAMASTTETLTVVLLGTFADTVTGTTNTTVADVLSGFGVTLTQVRDAGDQFAPIPAP